MLLKLIQIKMRLLLVIFLFILKFFNPFNLCYYLETKERPKEYKEINP